MTHPLDDDTPLDWMPQLSAMEWGTVVAALKLSKRLFADRGPSGDITLQRINALIDKLELAVKV